MSRTVAWRNKPTTLISQMIPVAKQLRLYLVNEIGPTSLILKDDNDNKFKVVIGNTISCSCNVVKNDHCIHSLFVMLKKFKVSQSHPIIWQASYLDSQLDGMTQQKYQQSIKQKSKISAKQFLKRTKINKKKQQDQEDFPILDQDEMCPICYQQMTGQCYSTCDTCHKSMHTKCFKVWTKHKQDSQAPVTCPMCRTKFTNPIKIIFRDLQKWQSRFSTHKGTNCKGCGQKNIKGLIYKCLICINTHLCKLCYQGNQHIQHDIYCLKQLSTDNWRVAPLRIKKTRKQLFQPIQDKNIRQLPSLQSKQFILNLLPTVKQYNLKQATNQLGIIGNQLLSRNNCIKCGTNGNQQMLRLHCSHSVHPQCLLYMVQHQQYVCLLDNQIICPGYWNALGIKINKQPIKKKQLISKNSRNLDDKDINQRKKQNNITNNNQDILLSNKKDRRNMSLGMMKQTYSINKQTYSINKQAYSINKQTFSINKQTITGMNRISGLKHKQSKIRPPTIPKKSNMQRRQQIQSLTIGGLGMGLGINTNFNNIGINSNLNNLNNLNNINSNEYLSSNMNPSSQKNLSSKNIPKFGLFSNKVIQR